LGGVEVSELGVEVSELGVVETTELARIDVSELEVTATAASGAVVAVGVPEPGALAFVGLDESPPVSPMPASV